ncbi:hypothetical protein [Actinoplanes sp. NPDC051494]
MFPAAGGDKVLVSVPASVGLDDDQVTDFARGITVTDRAQPIGG